MLTRIAVSCHGGGTQSAGAHRRGKFRRSPAPERSFLWCPAARTPTRWTGQVNAGIETAVCRDEETLRLVTDRGIDLIILAGYMSILSAGLPPAFRRG